MSRLYQKVALLLSSSKMFQKTKEIHQSMFTKYLLITNVSICSGVSAVSDMVCQRMLYNLEKTNEVFYLDYNRTKLFAGATSIIAPISHFYYKTLDKYLSGSSRNIVIKKLFIDSFVFMPACLSCFYVVHGILCGHSLNVIKKDLRDTGFLMWGLEFIFWVPIQIINFRFIPSKYRLVVIGVSAFFYDILFTYFYHILIS